MKFFTKKEVVGIVVILFLISLASFKNFQLSLRRARDSQRRSDLDGIANALIAYHEDFGFMPINGDNGLILACQGDLYHEVMEELKSLERFDTDLYHSGLRECEWGNDGLTDLLTDDKTVYRESLPLDPNSSEGFSYRYISNGQRFQLYAYLEGEAAEEGYREDIIARGLNCGDNICNYGKAFEKTPLEKSIQEYENELRELQN